MDEQTLLYSSPSTTRLHFYKSEVLIDKSQRVNRIPMFIFFGIQQFHRQFSYFRRQIRSSGRRRGGGGGSWIRRGRRGGEGGDFDGFGEKFPAILLVLRIMALLTFRRAKT